MDETSPLVEKVALRNIKDFSIPISVKFGDSKKLFWKWYSLSEENTKQKLEPFVKEYERQLEQARERKRQEERARQELEAQKRKEEEQKEKKEAEVEKVEVKKTEVEVEKKEEKKIEVAETKIEVKEAEPEQIESEVRKVEKEKPKKKIERAEEKPKPLTKPQTEYLVKLRDFLSANKVKVVEEELNKRERTVELVLELSSSLGKMNFFAIAKNKKVLSVADLMMAYYRGQEKKLPLILLNSGKFAKNAEEKAKELGITLKSLEDKL